MSLFIKKPSEWQFETSSSGGAGVEFVMVEGGRIWLRDPGGTVNTFMYGSAGVGLAAGIKLPKIGKIQLQLRGKATGGVVAPSAFPNTGKVYVLDSFEGSELRAKDIQGVCMFVELYGGVVVGGSATAMIFGMNPLWLAGAIALGPMGSFASAKLLSSATGILLMAGVNAGIQGGGGVGAFVGGLF
jgi:hypothetical protein